MLFLVEKQKGKVVFMNLLLCLYYMRTATSTQHFHNTFATNLKLEVVTSSNLNLPLKLLFCLSVSVSNNPGFIGKVLWT